MAKKKTPYSIKSSDVPVTQKMLLAVRDELKSNILSIEHRISSDMHEMRADMHDMKADIHQMKSDMHQMKFLMEEQNARNKVVLDGLANMIQRQDSLENRTDTIEKTLYTLRK